ncbi:MAG: class I SAM-dependent methyltransferase [Candidatus Promineifilaceae bacterium]|nr:class I SAM-dependent methyltransferase [Candidatus Promineifilaceae bacterium]
MDRTDPAHTEWDNETAERYARKYGQCATNRIPVEELQLPSAATIVDVGCGTGATLRRAADFVSDGALIGIDPVPRMIEIAREQTAAHPAAKRIEFRLSSADNLPVDDDVADFVFAFDSFDFWGDKERAMDEVRRILRPDGRFVVVKDFDMPDAEDSGRVFVEILGRSGFALESERFVEAEGVSFTMWVAALSG